jgi:integral membrane protein
MKPIHRLRLITRWEGVSFLVLLFVAMPLKYFAGMPMAVRIVGMLHGILFISAIVVLVLTMRAAKWPVSRGALVFVSTLVPFGPFLIDRKLKRYEADLAASAQN